MNKNVLKNLITKIPFPIGYFFSKIPFSLKLGKGYIDSINRIHYIQSSSVDAKETFIYEKTYEVVKYAFEHNDFYKKFYKDRNFTLDKLKNFKDISNIPIVTKKDLQEYELALRSNISKGALLINTGGTSGQPLDFYLDKDAFAREWAHMHKVWGNLGYKPTDIKLTLRGKNLGEDLIKYNPVHNEYILNSYADLQDVAKELDKIIDKREIKYIHGYPSSIANFANFLSQNEIGLLKKINLNLKGILLGSEYPAPIYRKVIKECFKAPIISWYGHSEMAILAYENEKEYQYAPFQSYGYTEAVLGANKQHRLIGTSYDNLISPFIRYDTGDFIKPLGYSGNVLNSFEISEGRIGEFIFDKNNQSISLTALIFGRHHKAFENASFIQVAQREKGLADIYITPKKNGEESVEWEKRFDLSNVNIKFSFLELSTPFLTKAGKVPLLIKK